MSSTSEEQTSINLAISDEEGCKLPVGKTNSDVEMGSIQDTVQFLFNSKHNHSNKISPSIHKIPSRIRELNEKVFTPRLVSIGPLHRDNVNLQAFEGQKAIFLHDLLDHLDRSDPRELILENCVQKVNDSLGEIKKCYGVGIEGYNDENIRRMMVMDGCFILEFIYWLFMGNFDGKMVIEPLSMLFDLVLMENQIPFFVLQDIFECTSSRFKLVTSLEELIIFGLVPSLGLFNLNINIKKNKVFNSSIHHAHILGFIHNCYMRPLRDAEVEPSSDFKSHILGFIHKCYRPSCDAVKKVVEKFQSPYLGEDMSSATLYSAVELDKAGVSFKPHHPHHQLQDGKWSTDIELNFPRCSWCRPWAKPTLRMPVLVINNFTELVFRNLIAYEQLSLGSDRHYFTSYAVAMDLLIDNHKDVTLLVKSKVLVCSVGSNKEAAKLFNDMCKGISFSRFFLRRRVGRNE